ncbi:MAG: hypothetical protein PHV97_03465, partial [Candidatus Omnitrophica bacterium]|nr:hypothetical protein [Candidatus Omnitrophota bacterium]
MNDVRLLHSPNQLLPIYQIKDIGAIDLDMERYAPILCGRKYFARRHSQNFADRGSPVSLGSETWLRPHKSGKDWGSPV